VVVFVYGFEVVRLRVDLNMKGVFVMNTSLHDILFMTLDNELRRHYHHVAVKQELCQVNCDRVACAMTATLLMY